MKFYTYKLNLLTLNVLAIVILFSLVIIHYVCFQNIDFITNIDLGIMLVALVFWFILHEVLHGIGFLILGRVKFKNVVFGAELENGIFYCMCKQKITKTNILISLLFPIFFIGIITYIIGLYFNNNLLILLSIVNISGAVGDIIMTLDILAMPNDIFYLDLDDATSFTILSTHPLQEKKYFGIKLDNHGKYTSAISAKDYQKWHISKTSIIILTVLLAISIYYVISTLIN